jgi:hypothetical protein
LPDIDDFAKALDSVFRGKATILNRMRLACSFYDINAKKIGDDGGSHSAPRALTVKS